MSDPTSHISGAYGLRDQSIESHKSGVSLPFTPEVVRVLNEDLFKKNIELKQELQDSEKKYSELKDAYADQGREFIKCKKENVYLNEIITRQKSDLENNNLQIEHFCDTRNFENADGEHPSRQWVAQLWDVCYAFIIKIEENGNCKINSTFLIVGMIKALEDNTIIGYRYKSSRPDMAYEWNANIAENQISPENQKILTITAQNITDNYRKVRPTSEWYRLSLENTEDSADYTILYNFKKHLETLPKK